MYKVVNGGSSEIIMKIYRFCEENGYNLKHQNTFKGPMIIQFTTAQKQFQFWDLKCGNLKNWFL